MTVTELLAKHRIELPSTAPGRPVHAVKKL